MINKQELDIDTAIAAHSRWYELFEQAILGIDAEKLDSLNISDDTSCVLGCWLYKEGEARYAGRPEFEKVLTLHRQFHRYAQEIVDLLHAGDVDGAEHLLHAHFAASFAELKGQLSALRLPAR